MKLFNKLELDKPIVFFDLETTGVDVQTAQIVQMSFIKIDQEKKVSKYTTLVKPTIPIPKGASDIHGITDETVENEKPFIAIAPALLDFIEGCDLAGYNIIRYDVPLLVNEFKRCGLNPSFDEVKKLDIYVLFCKLYPRDLTTALKFFCNEELGDDAHGAEADTKATIKVLKGMLTKHEEIPPTLEEIDKICYPERDTWVDNEGKFIYDKDGEIIVNFSKHKGMTLQDLVDEQPGFIKWVLNKDFTDSVKNVLRRGMQGITRKEN